MARNGETALDALSGALWRAFDRKAAGGGDDGRAFVFLFARLGAGAGDLDRVAAARDASSLPAQVRDGLATRLAREQGRLSRLARAGSALYDLDRHLAVHAASKWLAGVEPSRRAGGRNRGGAPRPRARPLVRRPA